MFLVLGCPDQFLSKLISFISLQYAVFKVRSIVSCLTNGDGEIRTLDPLLARQVLSQLSYTPTFYNFRQPPALPYRRQYSTIGRSGLNHRVRDGNGCLP